VEGCGEEAGVHQDGVDCYDFGQLSDGVDVLGSILAVTTSEESIFERFRALRVPGAIQDC
jgi:hypothetical protein